MPVETVGLDAAARHHTTCTWCSMKLMYDLRDVHTALDRAGKKVRTIHCPTCARNTVVVPTSAMLSDDDW